MLCDFVVSSQMTSLFSLHEHCFVFKDPPPALLQINVKTYIIISATSTMANNEDPGNSARANAGAALVVIVLDMALQGIAKTPRAAFTTTYVDANVEKTRTGFYMGKTPTFFISTIDIHGVNNV
jgi:hypothetical protein